MGGSGGPVNGQKEEHVMSRGWTGDGWNCSVLQPVSWWSEDQSSDWRIAGLITVVKQTTKVYTALQYSPLLLFTRQVKGRGRIFSRRRFVSHPRAFFSRAQ